MREGRLVSEGDEKAEGDPNPRREEAQASCNFRFRRVSMPSRESTHFVFQGRPRRTSATVGLLRRSGGFLSTLNEALRVAERHFRSLDMDPFGPLSDNSVDIVVMPGSPLRRGRGEVMSRERACSMRRVARSLP